jgi:EmrB/QacA subfamily drug resistance transporter
MRGKWWLLAVLCLGVIVVSLDLTILNIALPSISAALHAGTADLQWIVDAYALAFAGAMLPAGVLGDRLGRRRVLLAGLATFLAASLWCALAGSTGELIAARVLMGLGGAIVFPLTLAIVSATFGDAGRAKAIGIVTAAVALGLPLGPVLGGLLLQHFSWNSVFWINVPVVAVTLAAGAVALPESRNPAAPPFDGPGALLAAAAIVSLVFGVIRGPEHGWSAPVTIALLAGSVLLLAGFVVRERRTAHPLVDGTLFRDRGFAWGTVATVAVSVALFAIMFVLPQYLQSVHGDDALGTGLRLLPLMGGLLVAGGAASQAVAAIGTRLTVAAGLALLTAGLVLLSGIHLSSGYSVVAAGLALAGLGVGGSIGAAMDAVMAAVGGDEAGAGAAVNSTLRQVGGALAVAALGSALSVSYARALRPALRALPAGDAAIARESVTQAVQLARRLPAGGTLLREAAGAAFLHGMSIVMVSCAVVTALAALATLRYLPRHATTDGGGAARPPAPAPPAVDARR